MKINVSERHFENDQATALLVSILKAQAHNLLLEDADIYYEFPLYRSYEGDLVNSKLLVVSPHYGVFAFATSNLTRVANFVKEADQIALELRQSFSALYSRLLKNLRLLETMTTLSFPTVPVIFMPFLDQQPSFNLDQTQIQYALSESQLIDLFTATSLPKPIKEDIFAELVSTLEGAKGLIRQKPRNVDDKPLTSKGALVNQLEAEIHSFDHRQLKSATAPVLGPERIRGLAGSGKTVVLALKAALAHVNDEQATIVYTFHTKSLYQHIKRLITRFYRQYDDRDPDWSKLLIMHAWGGKNEDGVYYNACENAGVTPLTFSDARSRSSADPFGYACKQLREASTIAETYDYVFVDEAQDFPNAFLSLCVDLAKESKMVCAYDELQTIFRPKAVHPAEYLPKGTTLSEDFVLYKCYRNPREILVAAHALGFGIYGPSIVQMLENAEYWKDVGYEVLTGDFTEGSETIIERPVENSLMSISSYSNKFDIVKSVGFDDFESEIRFVVEGIVSDIADGLHPEDILVISVDDRNARRYLEIIALELAGKGVRSNNIHADSFNIRDFQRDGAVTLSTVHKAKGNEAYMVYVVGTDALLLQHSRVKERNMLFTAMTRAKGWVRVSGMTTFGTPWTTELITALENFPYLKFAYPSEEQLKIMKRDLDETAAKKQAGERKVDEALDVMSLEEIQDYLAQRTLKKGKK